MIIRQLFNFISSTYTYLLAERQGGEEKRYNPRLQVSSRQVCIDLMNGLDLDDPRLMDTAVPANRACGTFSAA
jgi:hypothetical protein